MPLGDSGAADQCDQPTQRPHHSYPMDRLQHSHAEEYPRKIGKKRRKNAEKCLRREEELVIVRAGEGEPMGLEPNYIIVDGQTFSKTETGA